MRIAVTGTPGSGKTSATSLVQSMKVLHVNDLVDELDVVCGFDETRKTKEVDVDKLAQSVSEMFGDFIFEGHFAHLLGVDLAIVLRCSPSVLAARLRSEGWDTEKIRENAEAEAVDVVLVEALEAVPEVCEIDTTSMTPEQVAASIDEIASGEREKYPVGHVDWSQEVLDWF